MRGSRLQSLPNWTPHEIGRHGLLDLRQEVAEFDRAVTLVAVADDPAGGNVQGGEQRGRTVPRVIMTAPLRLPSRIGSSGWVRSSAWICDFSSTHSTKA